MLKQVIQFSSPIDCDVIVYISLDLFICFIKISDCHYIEKCEHTVVYY